MKKLNKFLLSSIASIVPVLSPIASAEPKSFLYRLSLKDNAYYKVSSETNANDNFEDLNISIIRSYSHDSLPDSFNYNDLTYFDSLSLQNIPRSKSDGIISSYSNLIHLYNDSILTPELSDH